MEQVDQLLLLQAAYLEDIITVTNSAVAQVMQDRRNGVEVRVPVKCKTNETERNENETDRNETKQIEKKRNKSK